MNNMIICPSCNGEKEIKIFPRKSKDGSIICTVPCSRCNQSGELNKKFYDHGKLLRKDRVSRRSGLFQEATLRNLDPMIYSQMEQGSIDNLNIEI